MMESPLRFLADESCELIGRFVVIEPGRVRITESPRNK